MIERQSWGQGEVEADGGQETEGFVAIDDNRLRAAIYGAPHKKIAGRLQVVRHGPNRHPEAEDDDHEGPGYSADRPVQQDIPLQTE